MEGESSSSSAIDPKLKRKYDRLVENGRQLEGSDPSVALEMYKQAEEIIPHSLQTEIANVKAILRGDKPISSYVIPADLPTPPPLTGEMLSSLPDFNSNDFPESLPPPPPPYSSSPPIAIASRNIDQNGSPPSSSPSSVSSSPPHTDASNEELEAFFEQLNDFMQVMAEEDIADLVTRRDYQTVSYLMQCAQDRAPCDSNSAIALRTSSVMRTFALRLPECIEVMIKLRVVTWITRWLRFFLTRKAEQTQEDIIDEEHNETILELLKLLSVICGQPLPLSTEEKELLDEQTFITMMIQFTTNEWYIDEYSDISFEAAVSLYAISSQFQNPNEDPVVFALYGLQQAQVLGRHLIHVTNRGISPKWLQSAALSTSRKLFDFSQAQQRECYFFTNDIHVLLDVILREIVNLEESETEIRMEYLKLLRSVIVHHEYINKGRYKYEDVAELVNSIVYQGYDSPAAEFAGSIFEECFGSS